MRRTFSVVVTLACIAAAPAVPSAAQPQVSKVPESRAEVSLSFAPVVKQTAPAVVNVFARKVIRAPGLAPFAEDPFFRRFFGDDGFFGLPRERAQNSLGSGVIVSPDGVILTNHHVVRGGDEIRVVLSDRREFEARVVLKDERTDLAVLRIDAGRETLPHLALSDSDGLEVGDLVLAIGNPFGVGQTVTSGIVSALARTQVGISDYQFFIQTDAAINPGNSGGALVDMSGRLVGINTAIFSRSGGSHGVGFAIPSNMVRVVAESARVGDRVRRPWLGAELQEVTSDIGESLGFDRPRGALVRELHAMSPLAEAGIRRGDVLLGVAGRNIENTREFIYRFATRPLGGSAEVQYLRSGKPASVAVKLVTAPENPPRNETLLDGRHPFDGLRVANLSPALAEELGRDATGNGVVVLDIKGGFAAQLGFRAGDVVIEVNGRSIARVEDLVAAGKSGARAWRLAIERDGRVIRTQVGG
jgi:Do/DeqQ family serine protease